MLTIPTDRTRTQPVVAFCTNPECRDEGQQHTFEVSGKVECDKCGANKSPDVGLQVLVHMIVPDAAGKIQGSSGRMHSIACDPARNVIASKTNLEAGTTLKSVANCPGCLALVEDEEDDAEALRDTTGESTPMPEGDE